MEDQQKPVFGQSNPALNQNHDGSSREILMWFLGTLVLLLFIFWLVGFAAVILAKKIPDKKEVEWFAKIQTQALFLTATESVHPKFAATQDILRKLKSNAHLRDLPFSLHYFDNASPNAFAVPGGSIVVSRGLLDLVESPIGIAMVLGHEIGHHQARDPLKTMGRSFFTLGLSTFLFGGSTKFSRIVGGLTSTSYSRDQETAADEYGIDLVQRTFGSLDGAAEFFEKIAKTEVAETSRWMELLSTHPYTPDRIEHIKKRAAR